MNWRAFGGRQPFFVFIGIENDRLAIMNGNHHSVRIACEDGERVLPFLCLRVLPGRPKAGHSEMTMVGEDDLVFRLMTFFTLPLKERRGGDNAPLLFKLLFPKVRCGGGIRPGIEQKLFGHLEIPPHEGEISLIVLTHHYDRLN